MLLHLLFNISYAYSYNECFLFLNNKNSTNKNELVLSKLYTITFGSSHSDMENPITAYAIDIECNNRNVTANKHFYFDLNRIQIEINVINCSHTKEKFLNDFKINYDFHQSFEFNTNMFELARNVTNVNMKLSLNRRFGNGCLDNLNFQNSIYSNFMLELTILIIISTLILLVSVSICFIRKFGQLETKTIQFKIPVLKFKSKDHTMEPQFDSFDYGIVNNSLDLSTNLINQQTEPNINMEANCVKQIDESIQFDHFQILREQFDLSDEDKLNKHENNVRKNFVQP